MYGQEKRTITTITSGSPGWIRPPTQPFLFELHAAMIPIEIRSCGIASITSPARENRVSIGPRKKPAVSPTTRPIRTAIRDATTPTISDVRAPYIVRTKRSRPSPSAPNQNCEFGPFGRPNASSIVDW